MQKRLEGHHTVSSPAALHVPLASEKVRHAGAYSRMSIFMVHRFLFVFGPRLQIHEERQHE